ncbi:hypothetical protein TNCT_691501 [Trichonephila clavata]|uniref:Uncharacterized protein n=1 Tax=Trichonephila clavata TaxID=2740835 RepID=A0A8X6G9T4_TRICU|nr:hypothetical protein TNCT_691501 [Trichonephila clavata]
MKYLAVILLVALVHCAAAEGTEETKPAANQPAYQAAYQPYPYRSYSGYDTYRSRYGSYGQYPSSNYDLDIHTTQQLITNVIICSWNIFLRESYLLCVVLKLIKL